MVGVERGVPLWKQLWAAAVASTKPAAESMGSVVPPLRLYREPGCWMHGRLLPGQELGAEGLSEEVHAYRVEGSSC